MKLCTFPSARAMVRRSASEMSGATMTRERPDAILIYAGHNEYYGALGAGSTETLGAVPGFVRFYVRLQRFKTFLLLRNVVGNAIGLARGDSPFASPDPHPSRMETQRK